MRKRSPNCASGESTTREVATSAEVRDVGADDALGRAVRGSKRVTHAPPGARVSAYATS